MILSLDIRDYALVQHRFRRYPRPFFGLALPYDAQSTYAGVLAQGENLFISAHGSPETIGHPDGSPRFTAHALAHWLEDSVLPCNYAGDIYLAAPGSTRAFLDALCCALGTDYRNRIHGVFNHAYSRIIPPEHSDWLTGEYRPVVGLGLVKGVA